MEKSDKSSRRAALKRMAGASVGLGMGLHLIGAFVPAAHAAINAGQKNGAGIVGYMASSAGVAAFQNDGGIEKGSYNNGASYTNGPTYSYSQYLREDQS